MALASIPNTQKFDHYLPLSWLQPKGSSISNFELYFSSKGKTEKAKRKNKIDGKVLIYDLGFMIYRMILFGYEHLEGVGG